MRIAIDLDDTLCWGKPYEAAQPLPGAKELLARLRAQGHTVIIYTARGMNCCAGNVAKAIAQIGKLTLDQLDQWGFEYDEIAFGKIAYDVLVDDKALMLVSIEQVERDLQSLCKKAADHDAHQAEAHAALESIMQKLTHIESGFEDAG